MQELWFLHSAHPLMLIGIYMKFLDSLNRLQITERTQFCERGQRKQLKKLNARVMVVAVCMSSMLIDIYMTFHKDSLNVF